MESMERRVARLEERLLVAQSRARAMAAITAAVVIGSAALYLVPGATAQGGQGQAHGIAHRLKAVEAKMANLEADLAAETAARIAADLQLQANINAEAAARAAADTTLQANIDTEAYTRAAADTALQNSIDAEVAARATADTAIQNQVGPMASVLQPFSRVGTDVFITGANLNIYSGSFTSP